MFIPKKRKLGVGEGGAGPPKSGFGPETLQEIRTVPGGFLAQDREQINQHLRSAVVYARVHVAVVIET